MVLQIFNGNARKNGGYWYMVSFNDLESTLSLDLFWLNIVHLVVASLT